MPQAKEVPPLPPNDQKNVVDVSSRTVKPSPAMVRGTIDGGEECGYRCPGARRACGAFGLWLEDKRKKRRLCAGAGEKMVEKQSVRESGGEEVECSADTHCTK